MQKVKIENSGIKIADGNYSSKYPKSDEFVSKGVPFIRANNFNNKTIVDDELYFITEQKHKTIVKGHLKKNDILITTRGNIGNVAIVPERHEGSNINAQIVLLRCNKDWEPLFLLYVLTSNDVKKQLNELITGTALKQLSVNSLKKIEIPLPPLPTQQKIAAILDKADELRQYNQQLIEKYEALTQSLFLDMFGDPVKNEKGWEKTKVINYCTSIVPGRDKPKTFTGNIPWVTTEDLIQLGKTSISKKNIGLTEDEILNVRAKKIPIGSVIITCVGNLGVVTINEVEIIINQQLHAFQCLDGLNNLFLMHCLSYQKSYMNKMASSTTVPYMNKTVCNNIPIIVPPINLQNQFAERVQLIETQKKQAQEALAKSEELFQSLLQNAFKGELM